MQRIPRLESDSNLLKQLKYNYETPEGPRYQVLLVKRRTSKIYTPTISDDSWQLKYKRRFHNLSCGFFSNISQPFESVGLVHLDAKDLLADCITYTQLREKFSKLADTSPNCHGRGYLPDNRDLQSQQKQSTQDVDSKIPLSQYESAGMEGIRNLLHESTKHIADVTAGQPFEECVRQTQANRQTESSIKRKEDGAMVLMSLSELEIPKCTPVVLEEQGDEQQEYRGKENDEYKQNHKESTSWHVAPESDVTLPPRLRATGGILSHAGKSCDLTSASSDTVASPDVGAVSQTSKAPVALNVGRRIKTNVKPTSTEKQTPRLETWEDLFNVGGATDGTQSQSTATGSYQRQSIKRQEEVSDDRKEIQRTPPWQSIIDTNRETEPSRRTSRRQQRSTKTMVPHMKQGFNKLKDSAGARCKNALERIDREMCTVYRQKFLSLKLSPLYEQNLAAMRTSAKRIYRDVDVNIKPAQWYQDLNAEVSELAGKNDIEIEGAVAQLSSFMAEDSLTIAHGQQKLCLIVMSMPIFDLCTISMQAAILFVLDKILHGPEEQLHQWMLLRKFPVGGII
ncbi:PREDICTED: coiled-coil domain-containing protein 60-like isoform X3 [Priapulus caudatus]|uniref:Coiled-coil domain-containing protein 60-like isoform X3 n=1 Tax=Priapulus caudatus TaxID=37621 RepID=A0ABM1DYY6_PRICU|nr:PREDICTED: coiled-coil domain-containing protein 60-like isoform X3 [Priapulus caudatus]